jgi:hypothetical protein
VEELQAGGKLRCRIKMVQERDNYCLCSILSDIFLNYNIIISQKNIADNLTPTPKGFRADDNAIKYFLKKNSFDYNFYWWNQTPFNEPDSLLNEISNNEGFIGIEDHTYRVLEFEDPMIMILDPVSESPKEFNYYSVMDKFRKIDGGFGLMKYIH